MKFDDLKKPDAVYQQCREMFGGDTPAETYRKMLEFYAQQLRCYGDEGQSDAFAVGRLAAQLHCAPSQLGAVAVMLGADTYVNNLRQTGSVMNRETFQKLTEGLKLDLVADLCGKSTSTIRAYRTGALAIPAEVEGRVRALAHVIAVMTEREDVNDKTSYETIPSPE